jgi:ATP-binding cassette subfamily B (MDR/TAP) protein 1
MQAFTTGAAAGQKIFSTIDRVSPLDPETTDGLKPKEIIGEIELMNIKHIYPSRPEVVVMEDVSLMIPAGKTTALVGSSGSGKSTIVGLVERFYDPVGGNVYLDGVNVRDINLHYLRQNVALVSQEPTLFGTTIRGNIGHGLIGTSSLKRQRWQMHTTSSRLYQKDTTQMLVNEVSSCLVGRSNVSLSLEQ